MKHELRARIIAYNKEMAERRGKASDLDILIAEIAKLPPGQLKKVLTEPVLEVFRRHGISI